MPKMLILLLVLTSFAFNTGSDDLLQTEALPGDGVFSLLRRYELDRYACNHRRFYEINKLKEGSMLVIGRKYYLPISIHKFNGKTIRSSIGIDDWNTAKSIEEYNDRMFRNGYKSGDFRKDKELWVPYHLLHCPEPTLPEVHTNPQLDSSITESNVEDSDDNLALASGGNRIFPIFGKKFEHVPLVSNELRGKVFYVESGHGGPDPGAMAKVGKHTLCEDEYAYDVALRLARHLVAHGATTYLINRDPDDGIREDQYLKCDADEVVWGGLAVPASQKPRLTQRSDIINKLYEKHKKQGVKDQMLVVIHVDSRSHRQQTDLFFYYYPGDNTGKKTALAMHQAMKISYEKYRKGRGYDGTVTARDLHMLRETEVPSVYIELGNIRHPQDQNRIILASNRQLLADWLFEGLR